MKSVYSIIVFLFSINSFSNSCGKNLEGVYKCGTYKPNSGFYYMEFQSLSNEVVSIKEGEGKKKFYFLNEQRLDQNTESYCKNSEEFEVRITVDNSKTKKPYQINLNEKTFWIGKIEEIKANYKKNLEGNLDVVVSYDGINVATYICKP